MSHKMLPPISTGDKFIIDYCGDLITVKILAVSQENIWWREDKFFLRYRLQKLETQEDFTKRLHIRL